MANRSAGNWIPWLLLAIVLVAGWMAWPRPQGQPGPGPLPRGDEAANTRHLGTPQPAPRVAAPTARTDRGRASRLPDFLPPEAGDTIALIRRGGPFPHRQDASVFANREGRLPPKPRGWYREYTVVTPGLGHRGARRIVTGGDPPREWYYTADHYDSFRRFDIAGDLP